MKIGLWKKGLVLGIILFFVGAGAIPSMSGTVVEKTTILDSKSPGYIQELIDNASDGDTINIPSGTYYENLIINKSISLVGEDKKTTIIDGGGNGTVINIYLAIKVNINGFTIRNGNFGISIYNRYSGYNTITDNIISNNKKGISIDGASYNTIRSNIISNNGIGIYLSDRPYGWGAFFYSINNNIIRNIFLDNERDASFEYQHSILRFHLNHWRFNYWNSPRILPKLIFGEIEIDLIGAWGPTIPWINIDWRPAIRPYNDITEAENASVAVGAENSKIKIILTTGGQNYPSNGYSFANSVTIRLNGTALDENNLAGNIGWEVGESLFIGGSTPTLDDEEPAIGPLGPGSYSITVTIIETVVFDDSIIIV